jgi:hypothetical protein
MGAIHREEPKVLVFNNIYPQAFHVNVDHLI